MAIAEGTVVAGRYRIVRELGRGGMGSVYLAEHVNTGGHWALKVMHGSDHLGADRAARFRREARASSRISSENVVRVTDADVAAELDGAPFIVM
jgi:serine/threonine-protein kinase